MRKTSLAVLFMAMAVTAHAGKLSQLAAKVPRPLQQAVAVVVCATTCLVGFNPKAAGDWAIERMPLVKEMSAGIGSGPGHGFFSIKTGIDVEGDEERGSFFSIDALGTLKMSSNETGGNDAYLEHFDGHFFRMYMLPEGMSYAHANRLELALTSAGYDYYDKRSFELTEGTEGFRTGHLHWMGIDSSFLITKVGVGNLGLVKTGWFEQADLEAWAGDGAEFSYWFFLTNGIGIAAQPRDGQLSLGAKILQARTLRGDIDFADGTDGDFVAIWESIEADVEFSLLDGDPYNDVRIGIAASFYRQRLSAGGEMREELSQRTNGHRLLVGLGFYF